MKAPYDSDEPWGDVTMPETVRAPLSFTRFATRKSPPTRVPAKRSPMPPSS